MRKIHVGIIGSGNIGCDLLAKIMRSELLNCAIFVGRDAKSKGLQFAQNLQIPTTDQSIHYFEQNLDSCDIVFDATSAVAHKKHAPILRKLGKFVIDLTPSLIGKMCIPAINAEECLNVDNINMITCGGQASVPFFYAISRVQNDIKYFEVVASIASKSAGIGTRDNIDEFTQTTKKAIINFSNVEQAKAIIILNPADPPIFMNNTLFALVDNPNMEAISSAVTLMEHTLQEYVPGLRVKFDPVYTDGVLTIMLEVIGRGDYLPNYSGNLDIITCAALSMAERWALRRLKHG